ncbi:MAG: DUF4142 domain-containing protein [Myxococcaceae bacterium]
MRNSNWSLARGALLAGLLLAGSGTVSAADQPKSKVTGSREMENEARRTLAGLHDIDHMLRQWGQLGTEKGSREVRHYGKLISTQQANLDAKVMSAARSRELALPPTYSTFYDLGRRIQLETLRVPAGKDFDHAYLAVAPKVAGEQVNQLEKLRAKTHDPELLKLIDEHERALDNLAKAGRSLQDERTARRAPATR